VTKKSFKPYSVMHRDIGVSS